MLTKKSLLLGLGAISVVMIVLEEVHQMTVHRSGRGHHVSAVAGDGFLNIDVINLARSGDQVHGDQLVTAVESREVVGGDAYAVREFASVRDGAGGEVVDERGESRPGSESSEQISETQAEGINVTTSGETAMTDSESDADGGGYDVTYERDKERLRRSPYIYNEAREMERMTMTSLQRTVKTISGFLPYDTNFSRKNFKGCLFDQCQVVNNMSQADAILFRASAIRTYILPSYPRPPKQRWVMYTADPAIKNYGFDRKDVGSNFNWTVTYQLDSDFPNLFGRLRRQSLPNKDYDKIYDGKVNHTAWFVSHCQTWGRREEYVDRMQKIIPVDIFGGCSDRRCGVIHFRTSDRSLCLPMLSSQYKFYLAFENSFCKDYLTEKFFKLFQDIDVIPVVRGGFDYKKYLPSGIFVDAADFKSPEALAKYLLRLGNDKTEYVKMLKRKNRWSTTFGDGLLCTVCEALHTAGDRRGFIPDLVKKFNGDPSYCYEPTDLGDP